jgi:hypothetical protein
MFIFAVCFLVYISNLSCMEEVFPQVGTYFLIVRSNRYLYTNEGALFHKMFAVLFRVGRGEGVIEPPAPSSLPETHQNISYFGRW